MIGRFTAIFFPVTYILFIYVRYLMKTVAPGGKAFGGRSEITGRTY